MDHEICHLSAAELVSEFAKKTLSPVDVAIAVLDRIESIDGDLNAFTFVDRRGALQQACAAEGRWRSGAPLSAIDGVPASVKELLLADGWPIRRCSRATDQGAIATEDAPAVARLREAGAVLLGKTNSPEFGWKGVTDNPLFGTTRNPWDRGKTPGGSSGGAAVAAATGMGALHLGTDGGGSIRIPAAFTGIFGLKPSFGRVPVYPQSKFGSLSHVGPMTRTVRDSAIMLAILARQDPRDPYGLPPGGIEMDVDPGDRVDDLRVAYSPTLGYANVDPEVAAIVQSAALKLEALGARVDIVPEVMQDPVDIFRALWASGISATLASFPRDAREVMDPGLVELGVFGDMLDVRTYMNCDYERGQLTAAMNMFHQRYDLLLTPTEPVAAFPLAQQTPRIDQRDWIDWTPFTYPFNLTGQPAASIPCGFTGDGLPVGLQVVGPRYRDDLVLRACRAFEGLNSPRFPEIGAA